MVTGFVLLFAINIVLWKVSYSISAMVKKVSSDQEGLIDGQHHQSIRNHIWFKSPRFTETVLQVLTLGLIMYICLFCMELADRVESHRKNVDVLCTAFVPIVLSLILLPYMLAFTIPQLCIILSLDETTNQPLIDAVLNPSSDPHNYEDVAFTSNAVSSINAPHDEEDPGLNLLGGGGGGLFSMPPPKDYSSVPNEDPLDSWQQQQQVHASGAAASDGAAAAAAEGGGGGGAQGAAGAAGPWSAWDPAPPEGFDLQMVDDGAELEGLFAYTATGDTQISFPAGAKLQALSSIEAGWVLAQYGNSEGYVPASYVKCVRLPPAV
jgi:hypothetical protein